MSTRRGRLAAVATIGLLLATVACGSNKEEAETAPEEKPVVKIGFIGPINSNLAALATGMRNSVDLAVKEANANDMIPGWTLEFVPEDDQKKPEVGAQVAAKLADDPAMMGVVGTLNSSIGLQTAPILTKAGIVQISPANTGIELTHGADDTKPERQYGTYFRVATTDAYQGPFAAAYAYDTLEAKQIAVIHDNKTYGKGLAEAFAADFKERGGKILTVEVTGESDQDFSGIIGKIKPMKPDAIYYGGEYPSGSILTTQVKGAGLKVPVMGGDGMYDGTYITVAKEAAEGDLVTSVGAPAEALPSAKAFIADYEAAKYKEPFGAYGPQSYDSAMVLIKALAEVLDGETEITEETREDFLAAVQDTDIDGATGPISFDEYGDIESKVLTMYQVEDGEFVAVSTEDFSKSSGDDEASTDDDESTTTDDDDDTTATTKKATTTTAGGGGTTSTTKAPTSSSSSSSSTTSSTSSSSTTTTTTEE